MNARNSLRKNNSEKKLIINNVNYIDIDKYRDELIKLKQELNKRNKEYQELKVEYQKLEKDNKSNMKLIELIICESDSNNNSNNNINNVNPFFNINDNNKVNFEDNFIFRENENNNIFLKDDKNIKTKNLCKQTIKKLKDKYLYNKMKAEIMHLKEEISEKDTLMSHLKSNSKIIKLRELDNKYADTYHELVELRDKFKNLENIKQDYFITKNKMSNLFQQLDFYKKQGKKQKEQLEKVSLQNQNFIKIIENNESQKNIEENKRKYYKGENEKLKKQIKELSLNNYNLLDEMQKLKDKTNKNINKIKNENKKLKEENEKYKREIENLKKKLLEKNSDKENNKDDFFMTSTKIIGEINNNNKNITKDNKENINENEISVLDKNNESKKLETKDIEILDFKYDNEKEDKKDNKEEIKEEQKEEEKEYLFDDVKEDEKKDDEKKEEEAKKEEEKKEEEKKEEEKKEEIKKEEIKEEEKKEEEKEEEKKEKEEEKE